MHSVVQSPSHAARLQHAIAWLTALPAGAGCVVVGHSMTGLSSLVRQATLKQGASFGWHRFTVTRLIAQLAGPRLAQQQRTPAGSLGQLALLHRVLHQMSDLGRFSRVKDRAGLALALRDSLTELRGAGVSPQQLESVDPDLSRILHAYQSALNETRLADVALVADLANDTIVDDEPPLVGLPLLLLDPEVLDAKQAAPLRSLWSKTKHGLCVLPSADDWSQGWFGIPPETLPTPGQGPIQVVQASLFSDEVHPTTENNEEVVVFSAPGEGREATEIARRLLQEAKRGVPFDQMAILLHAVEPYRATLSEALRRARIPAVFHEGTRIPDGAGRAFLTLLACKSEGLTATRFAEYLSLGEVPDEPMQAYEQAVLPEDPLLRGRLAASVQLDLFEPVPTDKPVDAMDLPVVDGVLRVPRRWEQLIVDAAVIGGLDRWRRRLAGLEKRIELELAATDEQEHRERTLRETLAALQTLEAFALPLLQRLADLPTAASWGDWIDALGDLANAAIRHPARIHAVLGELGPMRDVGPVTLTQVQAVLGQRLLDLLQPPPRTKGGRVFVGRTAAARGLSFRVVAVPGLAERLFPGKIMEDTVLPDALREQLDARLRSNAHRVAAERLSLHLAVGAAEERLFLSYPRVDTGRDRPRVPSFYCLEVLRTLRGTLPESDVLVRQSAANAAASSVGWPAPEHSEDCIDAAEYDLVELAGVLQSRSGTARYLMEVNPTLARALRARHSRWETRGWGRWDGLLVREHAGAGVLSQHQLATRSFSCSALQLLSRCPYQFYLQTIAKLSPWEVPEAIERMPPLGRGSMIHDVLYVAFTRLREQGVLPLTPATLPAARAVVDQALDEQALRYADDLAPAIQRVWDDEVGAIRSDLHTLFEVLLQQGGFAPWRFELAFGLRHTEGRDPNSQPDPVVLDCGIRLRGAIDLIEKGANGHVRVTDYKTGRPPKSTEMVIQGGRTLQPVLYALAVEKLLPEAEVEGGRLFFCTTRGRFREVFVPLDQEARDGAERLALVADRLLSEGFLPAAPDDRWACEWCDHRAICGPRELERTRPKQRVGLHDLLDLRGVS